MALRQEESNPELDGAVQETEFSAHPAPQLSSDLHEQETPLIYTENTNQQPYSYGSISTAPASSASPPSSAVRGPSLPRAVAPDLLRGLLMVFQAIDHSALFLGAWDHGLAHAAEEDGTVVDTWNEPVAWTARMLTHTCAPGFTFLLGMGVVYFCRSRSKLGWSAGRMTAHFFIRAMAIFLVNQIFLTLIAGRGHYWLINVVLVALAVDYLLAGLICLIFMFSEKLLTDALASMFRTNGSDDEPVSSASESSRLVQSNSGHVLLTPASVSWHIHNCLLGVLAFVSIGWNHWLSRDQGRCYDSSIHPLNVSSQMEVERSVFFDFWFYSTQTETMMSAFPPLAWLSFAVLGILYGRLLVVRPWTARAINLGNVLAGCVFSVVFVSTRLLHFGNLSEDCLQMPEQQAHPNRNQYLISFRSFLYVVKYPPSAAFLALTMALNFFLLAFFGSLPAKVSSRIPGLLVFGTSALFFYILHFIVYTILSIPVKHWFGHELGHPDFMTGKPAVGVGDTPVYWLTYLAGLMILYPCCLWYGRFKSRTAANSIWRFF